MLPWGLEWRGPLPRVQVAINLYTYSVLGIFLVAVPWTPMWAQATLLLGTEAFTATFYPSVASGYATVGSIAVMP